MLKGKKINLLKPTLRANLRAFPVHLFSISDQHGWSCHHPDFWTHQSSYCQSERAGSLTWRVRWSLPLLCAEEWKTWGSGFMEGERIGDQANVRKLTWEFWSGMDHLKDSGGKCFCRFQSTWKSCDKSQSAVIVREQENKFTLSILGREGLSLFRGRVPSHGKDKVSKTPNLWEKSCPSRIRTFLLIKRQSPWY